MSLFHIKGFHPCLHKIKIVILSFYWRLACLAGMLFHIQSLLVTSIGGLLRFVDPSTEGKPCRAGAPAGDSGSRRPEVLGGCCVVSGRLLTQLREQALQVLPNLL